MTIMKKKILTLNYRVALLGLAATFAWGCHKLKDPTAGVTTAAVGNITQTSAVCGGNVVEGPAHINEKGICFNTSPDVYYGNYTVIDNSGTDFGSFSVTLKGLWPHTTYYAKAYAINTNHFTGYGKEVSFTTLEVPGETVTDIDGNVYHTVVIGSQTWMFENLKVTHYRNGDAIPQVTGDWGALTTGACCWYIDDRATYMPHYGALYNWYAVSDPRNICPAGWHVPTTADWNKLFGTLGGVDTAGCKLKENGYMHWDSEYFDPARDNSSGFTALPGGLRQPTGAGSFAELHQTGNWWSATNGGLRLKHETNKAELDITYPKTCGLSVRCVKD